MSKETPPGAPGLLDIRKYSNRRYYDTTRSRHLTLEEIRVLVRDGHSIKVTDSKSGADITAQVLTQIILELETPKLAAVPVSFLAQLIRINEQMIANMGEKYVSQPFEAWLEYQRQMEERLRQMQGLQALYSPLGAWSAMPPPFGAPPPPPPRPAAEPAPAGEAEETRALLRTLREEVEALKRKAARAGKRAKKPKS